MAECHYRKNSISKLGKMYQLKPEILQAFMDSIVRFMPKAPWHIAVSPSRHWKRNKISLDSIPSLSF
jgi:hypothetical protein